MGFPGFSIFVFGKKYTIPGIRSIHLFKSTYLIGVGAERDKCIRSEQGRPNEFYLN